MSAYIDFDSLVGRLVGIVCKDCRCRQWTRSSRWHGSRSFVALFFHGDLHWGCRVGCESQLNGRDVPEVWVGGGPGVSLSAGPGGARSPQRCSSHRLCAITSTPDCVTSGSAPLIGLLCRLRLAQTAYVAARRGKRTRGFGNDIADDPDAVCLTRRPALSWDELPVSCIRRTLADPAIRP